MDKLTHLEEKIKNSDIAERYHIRIGAFQIYLYQLTNGKIFVSNETFFFFSARDMDEVLRLLSVSHGKEITLADLEIIGVEKKQEDVPKFEEVMRNGKITRRVPKDFFPKRFNKRSGVTMYGKYFYIVKKTPWGLNSKYFYFVYSWESRLLLFVAEDKLMCEALLTYRYKTIEEWDY